MLGKLHSIQSEKGLTLLTLAMSLGVMAVLGGAITIATIQVFRGASYNQVQLAPSAGQFKQAGETIGTAKTQIQEHPISVQLPSLRFAIVSTHGNVEMGGNAQVTSTNTTRGGVYARGDVVVKNSADVFADVTATGSINILNSGTINGLQRPNYSPGIVFLSSAEITVLAEQYKEEALAGGSRGDLTINSSQDLGPIYINGDLEIRGSADVTLRGTVYVTGEIEMKGSGKIISGTGGPWTLVAEEEITLKGNGTLDPGNIPIVMSLKGSDQHEDDDGDDDGDGDDDDEDDDDEDGDDEEAIECSGNTTIAAVLYAPYGKIKLGGSSTLYGSAMARSIESTGSSVIYPFAQ